MLYNAKKFNLALGFYHPAKNDDCLIATDCQTNTKQIEGFPFTSGLGM